MHSLLSRLLSFVLGNDSGRTLHFSRCGQTIDTTTRHQGVTLGNDSGKPLYLIGNCKGPKLKRYVGKRLNDESGIPVYAIGCCQPGCVSMCAKCDLGCTFRCEEIKLGYVNTSFPATCVNCGVFQDIWSLFYRGGCKWTTGSAASSDIGPCQLPEGTEPTWTIDYNFDLRQWEATNSAGMQFTVPSGDEGCTFQRLPIVGTDSDPWTKISDGFCVVTGVDELTMGAPLCVCDQPCFCNLCIPYPNAYTFTTAGFSGGGCCGFLNGTFVLDLSIPNESSQCLWRKTSIPCGMGGGIYHWTLSGGFPTGSGSKLMRLSASDVGAAYATYEMPVEDWDCFGSNVMSFVSGTCATPPATITVEPA